MKETNIISRTRKATIITCYLAGLGWSSLSHAIELSSGFGLDVSLSAMSDYRDTGVSQTKGDPAVQAEFTLNHESGLYVGALTTNYDMGTKAYREDMYYAGITIPFSEDISLDTYVGRYEYPNEAALDFNEFYAMLGAYGFELAYTIDFDYRYDLPDSTSVSLGYNFELPYESNLFVRYGHTDSRLDAYWSASGEARQTYYDWEVRLSKQFAGVDVFASYIDTDLSKSECYSSTGIDDICSATVVVGLNKTF